jgi:ATP-dependent Lon protease
METQRIPLFPLEVVLFPGMVLPLHIFESRYKLMIRRCLRTGEPFGIALIRGEEIVRVGCTASILRLVRQYDDGRMDILTVGRRRCRIAELFRDQPYLEADVGFLEESDEPATPASSQLVELYQRCHQLAFGRPPAPAEAAPGASLAFQIAGILPLDLEARQEVLETDRELHRQTLLLLHLQAQWSEFARLDSKRRRAGGNGESVN